MTLTMPDDLEPGGHVSRARLDLAERARARPPRLSSRRMPRRPAQLRRTRGRKLRGARRKVQRDVSAGISFVMQWIEPP